MMVLATLDRAVISNEQLEFWSEVLVIWNRQVPHPQYGKQVRTSKRFLAHDEEGIAQVGDYVKLVPTRPISKNKHFAVDEIVKKAK